MSDVLMGLLASGLQIAFLIGILFAIAGLMILVLSIATGIDERIRG